MKNFIEIIFTVALPSLKNLMMQDTVSIYNPYKWSLLQWLLGVSDDVISEFRTSANSKFIRVVNLTLKFLITVSLFCSFQWK